MSKPRCLWVWVFLFSWLLAGTAGAAGTKDQDPRVPAAPPEQKADQKPGKKIDPKAEMKPAPKPEQKADKKADPKVEKKPVQKAGQKPKVKPEHTPEYYLEKLAEKMGEHKPAKKVDKKAKKPDPKPHAPPAATVAAAKPPAAADDPQTFLARAREKEAAGDIAGCLQVLSRFINLFPRHAERDATLMRMAQLARDHGQPDKALQIYALAASLNPDSQMAAEARWQTCNLEFYQDLRGADPLVSFRNFLKKVTLLTPGVGAEKMRGPIRAGWREVERAMREKTPCPAPLVEGALALWEAHPEGTHPPEAALLLGELLMGKGLHGVARGFLQRAQEQGSPGVRAQALVGLLEAAWDSRNLPEFAGVWKIWRQSQVEITPLLRRRLEKLPLPEGFLSAGPGPNQERKPDEDAVAALLDWWGGKSPDAAGQLAVLRCLEHFLRRPLPRAVKEKLQLQLAQLEWSQGNFSKAARIYQELAASAGKGDNSAFYRDRLALTQLKARRPEEAMEIYQGLSQGEDKFWQLLSRTRLADVELGRLQTEPLPND